MKQIALLFSISGLAGCGQSDTPGPDLEIPAVEELAAEPTRLKTLREQCKKDRADVGDALCDRVAEATRKRFYGDGKVPYTPSETPPEF